MCKIHISIQVIVADVDNINRAAADKDKRDESFFLNGIRHLANFYDFDASDDFDYSAFHRFLEQLDKNFTVMTKLREVSAYPVG